MFCLSSFSQDFHGHVKMREIDRGEREKKKERKMERRERERERKEGERDEEENKPCRDILLAKEIV